MKLDNSIIGKKIRLQGKEWVFHGFQQPNRICISTDGTTPEWHTVSDMDIEEAEVIEEDDNG